MSGESSFRICPSCGAKNRIPSARISDRPLCGKCHSPLSGQMNEEPIAVTDAIFEKAVIGSKLPVLLDCWAPWCAPCRMIAPIVEDIARDYRNRLTVAKLNVDENPSTAGRLDIKSIPSLLLFKNGSIAGRIVGAVPRQEIERHIQTMLET